MPELKRISKRFNGDGGGEVSVDNVEAVLSLFVSGGKFLSSCIELIVRARTEPGEKTVCSPTSDGANEGITVSSLKRRARIDGDVSSVFLLFLRVTVVETESDDDKRRLESVDELVRGRGELFLFNNSGRFSFVDFDENVSSSK